MATWTRTDTGIACIIPDGRGAETVVVCASVDNGHPREVYAVHARCRAVMTAPGLEMRAFGSLRFTNSVVRVVAHESGTVHIDLVRSNLGTGLSVCERSVP